MNATPKARTPPVVVLNPHYSGLVVGRDPTLTAAEFRNTATRDPTWRGLLDALRITRRELLEANHTFSRQVWREKGASLTLDRMRRS